MVFIPSNDSGAAARRREAAQAIAGEGWRLLGWRKTPVQPERLGQTALASMPAIWQFFATPPEGGSESSDPDGRERAAYVLRRRLESSLARPPQGENRFYVCSLSFRTIVYKGMMTAAQLDAFYTDLTDSRCASPFAIVHQRYSTNTFPAWHLAHPFRNLAHNGEINTIRGNRNQMRAREPGIKSTTFGSDIGRVFPIIEGDASDSADLDNALEFLRHGGRGTEHAMAMLMP